MHPRFRLILYWTILRLAVKLDPSYNKNHFLAKENPRGNNA